MKICSLLKRSSRAARRVRHTAAFTAVEMMVSVFIFVFLVLGVIYAILFGMRWDELVCSKLGASDKSRMSFDLLTSDIRSAKWWKIGNGDNDSFVSCTNAMNQAGNAVKLSTSGEANSPAWVLYYFDTNNCQLCRYTNGAAYAQIIAQNLTNSTGNSMQFTARKFDGSLAQDWQYKYAIRATMEFCQYQYPLTKVGPGYYYNYYCIQIQAASHCPN